ncbi:ATP-grasp superfamily enzyme [Thermoplasmatales archaeon ex4572_165]|nr:MAG: ATP-grasp superfamily enzyme [Thermoplasmatales archaeon ex4572_165]RLF59900.1 MAG: proteasome assembly chaperone family protein [Thermoplasmata archaeon]
MDGDVKLHNESVKIIDFEKMDLTGATVIAGFPSIGLVSTIAANYLIDALNLKQVGALNSDDFPALSVVHTGEPLSPVRIYAGEQPSGHKIVVFVSEFKPKPHLINSISQTIMQWVNDKKCDLLISPEGMVVEGKEDSGNISAEAFAIGSTINIRQTLSMKNIAQFKNGIIAGVSGVLLNKGKQADFNVVSILTEAHPKYPDARAAAAAINVIASIIDVDINVSPLYEESERIEQKLQKFHQQAKPMVSTNRAPQPNMYG